MLSSKNAHGITLAAALLICRVFMFCKKKGLEDRILVTLSDNKV